MQLHPELHRRYFERVAGLNREKLSAFKPGQYQPSGEVFKLSFKKPRGTRAEARANKDSSLRLSLSSFLPLIYVISLLRSPDVTMREEGRPLAVYCVAQLSIHMEIAP